MPKQEYTFEPIVRKGKKGGIDAVVYRDKILLPLLYPFYEQVRDAHPDREVWLIEDNASSHQKAAKMCYHGREIRGSTGNALMILHCAHCPLHCASRTLQAYSSIISSSFKYWA